MVFWSPRMRAQASKVHCPRILGLSDAYRTHNCRAKLATVATRSHFLLGRRWICSHSLHLLRYLQDMGSTIFRHLVNRYIVLSYRLRCAECSLRCHHVVWECRGEMQRSDRQTLYTVGCHWGLHSPYLPGAFRYPLWYLGVQSGSHPHRPRLIRIGRIKLD